MNAPTVLDTLIAESELGEEARNFLASDLGKCLIGLAQQELMEAQEKLERVDPDNKSEINKLQMQAWRGRSFENWLKGLVADGENAIQVFQQHQQKG